MEKDVGFYEPILALDGGLDGLSEIRKVIKKSSELIKKNGKLVLEIGFDQKNKVIDLLKKEGFYINSALKDLVQRITDALKAQKYNLKIMVTFRNNNTGRRNNFRRNDRNFKSNGDRQKFSSNFANNNENLKGNFLAEIIRMPPKLIEKYNDLAREASSNGDKILSENYLQHADHFTRILNERENYKREKISEQKIDSNENSSDQTDVNNSSKFDLDENSEDKLETKKY